MSPHQELTQRIARNPNEETARLFVALISRISALEITIKQQGERIAEMENATNILDSRTGENEETLYIHRKELNALQASE